MNNEIRTGGPHLDTVEIYNPERDHLVAGNPQPTPLQGPAVATIDDRIYITAGIGELNANPIATLTSLTQMWESGSSLLQFQRPDVIPGPSLLTVKSTPLAAGGTRVLR